MGFADANVQMVRRVADLLGDELLKFVAFLGGATTALLLTDPTAEVRPTRDVDVIVEAVSYGHYAAISDKLRARGFHEDDTPGAPVCRWRVDGLLVDVMPTDENILGFSNRWYPEALRTARPYELPATTGEGAVNIRLVTAPLFLATKLEAFFGRGKGDFYASHDMEDVVTLLDGRPELSAEMAAAPEGVRSFVAESFRGFLARPEFGEALEGLLPQDETTGARLAILQGRIGRLASDATA